MADTSIGKICLKILVDNHAQTGLLAEHGYAIWVEADDRIILLDTGNKDVLLPNSGSLDCSLEEIDDLVISHGHYDHTGGIEAVLQRARKAEIYIHQGALQPRYSRHDEQVEKVRVPITSLKEIDRVDDALIHWATRPIQITDHIGVTGPIPRRNEFEDSGGDFYLDQQCRRMDTIEDDIALWLRSNRGIVVCVGCSHAGIVNTLEAVMEITGESTVHTVIGGLHLLHASKSRLEETVRAFNRIGVKHLVACHCTGDGACDYLRENLYGIVTSGYAGFSITF